MSCLRSEQISRQSDGCPVCWSPRRLPLAPTASRPSTCGKRSRDRRGTNGEYWARGTLGETSTLEGDVGCGCCARAVIRTIRNLRPRAGLPPTLVARYYGAKFPSISRAKRPRRKDQSSSSPFTALVMHSPSFSVLRVLARGSLCEPRVVCRWPPPPGPTPASRSSALQMVTSFRVFPPPGDTSCHEIERQHVTPARYTVHDRESCRIPS
jgi:hypothetical protein